MEQCRCQKFRQRTQWPCQGYRPIAYPQIQRTAFVWSAVSERSSHCTYICDIDEHKQDYDKRLSRNRRSRKRLLWTVNLAQNLWIQSQIDAEHFIEGVRQ